MINDDLIESYFSKSVSIKADHNIVHVDSFRFDNEPKSERILHAPTKLKIKLIFESEKGITLAVINDVMASSAMPFVFLKLSHLHLQWSKDVDTGKGVFLVNIQSLYYNPIIVTMEPLLEPTKMRIDWLSISFVFICVFKIMIDFFLVFRIYRKF